MSPKRTLSTTLRILRQLRHDHRTVGLILFMPSVLMAVLYYVFEADHRLFNGLAPVMLGIIPFILMFIITSVGVLRERTSGTLERLLTSPLSKADILGGYAIAFALLALLQAAIASFVTLNLLDVTVQGGTFALLVVAVLSGVLGMSFGLLFSAFARNEFQAVQFMPAFVLPQLLTCGLFTPRNQMAGFLEAFSNVMPITYVVEALRDVQRLAAWPQSLTDNVIIIVAFTLFALVLGAASLRGGNSE